MRRIILASASVLALMSHNAVAATATGNLNVQIVISAACTVGGGTLNFGNQGILASNVDQDGSLSVTCTNGTPYTVALDNGANNSSGQRRMKHSTNNEYINYNIYTNTGRTAAWAGTTTVAGTGNGSAQTLNVYGRVPAQTTGSPGTYTDTVTVTVTY